MVIVYYSERIQTEISEGKKLLGQSPGDSRHQLPVAVSSRIVQTALTFPSNTSYVSRHIQSTAN